MLLKRVHWTEGKSELIFLLIKDDKNVAGISLLKGNQVKMRMSAAILIILSRIVSLELDRWA